MEEQRTQALIATERQKVVERESETDRRRAVSLCACLAPLVLFLACSLHLLGFSSPNIWTTCMTLYFKYGYARWAGSVSASSSQIGRKDGDGIH
jgi:hypothetical protein